MADTRLILGGITFTGFEIPEEIRFGGRHTIHKHTLIGGARVLDMMGPDDNDITWSGRFRGNSAVSRALAVDALRQSGAEMPLTWGGLFFIVVVSSFEANYQKRYEIPYQISCMVSQTAGGGGFGSTVSALIGADLGALGAIAGLL